MFFLTMNAIQISNLFFGYQDSQNQILKGINLTIQKGEYIAVSGSNGSGKSTLARLIANIEQPTEGTVEINPELLPGIVFQQPKEQVIAGIVERDTAFGPQNLKMTKSEIELRTIECLSVTGLLHKATSRTYELSLGQTQRLSFAGILALFPDILILDEVTSMLDPKSRESLLNLVDDWHRKGHTIIHITHDKDELQRAQRVIAMQNGSIFFDGTPKEFFNKVELVSSLFGPQDFWTKEKCSPKNAEIVLQAQNLSFSYDSNVVFKNLNFSLQKGTLNAITGPSGCGKSTTLECLSGLLKPDSGNIYANSRPVLSLQESEAAIFEQSACDDVAFGPKNKGVKGPQLIQIVKDSMDLAGIPFDEFAERSSFNLSGGEKRKLSLAGLIAMDSEIMLFDEPTAGLDPISRQKIMLVLKQLAAQGKTILFSTHRMEEAEFAHQNIKWEELISESKQQNQNDTEKVELNKLSPLQNQSMISSIKKAGNLFQAPAKIPNSIISRMPAWLKYFIFLTIFISSIFVKPLWLCFLILGASIIYSLAAKYPILKAVKTYFKLLPWILFFSIFNFIFFPNGSAEILFQWKFFIVTQVKLLMIETLLIRCAVAVLTISTFIFSTSEREILDGLAELHLPKYFVLTVGIIFRFIPILMECASSIIKTQLNRGGFAKAKGIKKFTSLLPLFIPLILQTFKKSQHLADSLTARYFK